MKQSQQEQQLMETISKLQYLQSRSVRRAQHDDNNKCEDILVKWKH